MDLTWLNLLEILFERMPMGIVITDREGVLQRCNPTFVEFVERYYHSKPGKVVSGALMRDLAPEWTAAVAPLIQRALAGETIRLESARLESSGTVSYWDVVMAPLLESGQVVGAIEIATDATERVLGYQELEQRVKARTRELSAILEAVQAANGSLELEEVLRLIAKFLAAALGVRSCGVYLVDEEKGLLIPTKRRAAPETHGPEFNQAFYSTPLNPARDAFTRQVLEGKLPVVCYDVQSDPRTDKDIARRLGLKSLLAVPFVAKERVLAVAMVSTFDDYYDFSEDQIELARGIASSAAIAIENAMLYAKMARNAAETQMLFGVQQALTSRLDPEAILQLIVDEARKLTSAEIASVFLLEGDELRNVALSGVVAPGLLGVRVPLEQSLGGAAIIAGEPVRVADVQNDPRAADLIRHMDIHSFLGVPMIADCCAIGSISVANKQSGEFGPEDERVLTMLASSAVISLENARLYSEEQERRREEEQRRRVAEGLREIVRTLNSAKPIQEVLDYVVAQANQLMGSDATLLFRIDHDSEQVVHDAYYGLSPELAEFRTFPLYRSRGNSTIIEGRPAVITDISAYVENEMLPDPRLPDQLRGWHLGVARDYRSLLAASLVVKDTVYGGLVFYYRERRDFSDEDIRLATTIGDHAALSIENARLYEQAQHLAAVEERQRLARDLHDAVTQTLFSASLIAEVLPRLWERNQEDGRRRLGELRQLTRGALAEMRTLLLELRPAALTDAVLGDLLRQLAEATTGRARVPVILTLEGEEPIPPELQIVLYRIAQEALNNVARHSGASKATVSLRCQPDEVELRINDDGRGFDPASVPLGHLGLGIMRERAEAVGVTLSVESQIGHGAQIVATWTDRQGGKHHE